MYFEVAIDSSNQKSTKLFPIVIQFFDWKNGGLQSKLLKFKTRMKNLLTLHTKLKKP